VGCESGQGTGIYLLVHPIVLRRALRIRIIAVGKIREPYLQDGIKEYLKRLGPYFRVEILEIPEERIPDRCSGNEKYLIQSREGGRILAAVPDEGPALALDPGGEAWTSGDLARFLSERNLEGVAVISFLIGGPLGLPPEVRNASRHTVSLSRMTFPHQMVRLILLEQIYRASKILSGEPYHK